jgi:hypothetical protein
VDRDSFPYKAQWKSSGPPPRNYSGERISLFFALGIYMRKTLLCPALEEDESESIENIFFY